MKQTIHVVTLIVAIGTIIFALLYYYSKNSIILTVFISFAVTFYHFGMRLLVGQIIGRTLAPYICIQHKWFEEKPFERRLYEILKVKKWKRYIPSYAPETFRLEKEQLKNVISTMCASELVHEVIMVCSFLPILCAVIVGQLPVFFITSSLAATIDCIFVLLQRFNRPRLLKLMEADDK